VILSVTEEPKKGEEIPKEEAETGGDGGDVGGEGEARGEEDEVGEEEGEGDNNGEELAVLLKRLEEERFLMDKKLNNMREYPTSSPK
jgi:hypothetical protein